MDWKPLDVGDGEHAQGQVSHLTVVRTDDGRHRFIVQRGSQIVHNSRKYVSPKKAKASAELYDQRAAFGEQARAEWNDRRN